MSFRHIAFAFALGILLGFVLRGGNVSSIPPRKTEAPFHMSSVAETGVSHNPEIKKRVLAGYLQLPHITQVAHASIKVGQVADENWHRDMAEMFIFVQGEGLLRLDNDNHSVTAGSVALVFPPTRHTIYNTGYNESLDLFTIASIP